MEVVPVALTAAVPELLADAVAAVVEPLDLIFGARAVFVAQETEFCRTFRLRISAVAVYTLRRGYYFRRERYLFEIRLVPEGPA